MCLGDENQPIVLPNILISVDTIIPPEMKARSDSGVSF